MTPVDYDIVIIGCGPAGTTTARVAAQKRLKVLLVDKRQELGAPIQCSGALSASALEEAGISTALLLFLWQANSLQVNDNQQIKRFYMFFWGLFFLEYLIYPLGFYLNPSFY